MEEPLDRPARQWWLLGVAAVALLLAANLALADADDTPTEAEVAMLAVSPGGELAFDDIPEEQQELYLAAEADPEAFEAVRCYCGCEEFLEHADLRSCFLRADGAWEAHATGCGICLAEAEMVLDLREQGRDVDAIVDAVDDRYAAITS